MTSDALDDDERDRLLYELPTNVVVAAGAGTGKTHRLTGLYVHLVAGLADVSAGQPLRPDEIVATTFTREAAAEMRTRIEARLRVLATTPLDALVAAGGEPALHAAELARTCARRGVKAPDRAVFRRALEILPRATITTFHAWAGELVRTYPIEARVPPGFSMLEPEAADALVARAVDAIAGEWIDAPADARVGVHSKRDAIRRLLVNGIDHLLPSCRTALLRIAEEGTEAARLLLADDERAIARAEGRRRAMIDGIATIVAALPSRSAQGAEEILVDLRATIAEIARKGVADETLEGRAGELVSRLVHKLRNESELKARLQEALDCTKNYTDAARQIAGDPERTAEAAALEGAARAFLAEVEAHVASAKLRARALDFGDVLRRARDLLLREPEIQAEVAAEIRALLVDEFQDTNAVQRDLVYLVRQRPEAIAKRRRGERPQASELSPTGLFLVGDRKQSIYGFRGADVAVFQQIALDLAGDEAGALLGFPAGERSDRSGGPSRSASDDPCDPRTAPAQARGRIVALDRNRRSVDEVLRFVNGVAEDDMRGHEALAPVERVVFQPALEALRAVRSSGRDPAAPNRRVFVPLIEPSDSVSGDLAAALAIAGELRELLADPGRADLATPLRARDIAILIRTYTALPALETALAVFGLEYAIAAGRGLFATSEAGDLDALVRLAIDPRDRNAVLAVLRGPFVALSDRTLLSLAAEGGLDLPRATDLPALDASERARVARLLEVLDDLARNEGRLSPGAALGRALARLDYERTLAMLPGGEARIRDARRLLELADGFPTGLSSFGRYLAQGRAGDLDEARGAVFDDEQDAIRILTIHASKGLEFPVVVVMQVEHVGPSAIQGPLVVARGEGGLSLATRIARAERAFGLAGRELHARAIAGDRAERQRLTYVALTRARDLLYAVPTPRARKPSRDSAALSIFAVVERDPTLGTLLKIAPRIAPRQELPAAPIEAPVAAFGEGPFAPTRRGSVVVTTALAEFAICARRFRLLHVAALPEHAPRARPLPDRSLATPEVAAPRVARALPIAGRAAGQADAFVSTTRTVGDPVAGHPIDEVEISFEDLEGFARDDDVVPLPVGPLPSDPRAQGVLAHVALERAPLESATGRAAREYAERFLRGEGYDPETEAGRAIARRIVRFLGSAYAESLASSGVVVLRERPFVVDLPSGIALRGTIDLAVVRPRKGGGTRIEVVDYKSGAGDAKAVSRYALQLRAYAVACGLGAVVGRPGGPVEIVAGIAFLGGGDGAPIWLGDRPGGDDLGGPETLAEIDAIAGRLLDARLAGAWPAAPRATCDAIRCGFLPLCHPDAPADPHADELAEESAHERGREEALRAGPASANLEGDPR